MTDTQNVVLIVPIAFDLVRNKAGEVICGPGSNRACMIAVAEAKRIRSIGANWRPVIFLSATKASQQWDSVVMGKVMQQYVANLDPEIETLFFEAKTFNTLGEILSAAHVIEDSRTFLAADIDSIVFTVKNWHERRVLWFAIAIFGKKGIQVPTRSITYPLPASWKIRILEIPKTLLGLLKIMRMKLG